MNRKYNDNKMYNSALDELRFSDEAKSRMVNRLMAAAEQPEQPVAIHRVRRFPRIAAVGATYPCRATRLSGDCGRHLRIAPICQLLSLHS